MLTVEMKMDLGPSMTLEMEMVLEAQVLFLVCVEVAGLVEFQ